MKNYKRIPKKFLALLTESGQAGLREAVETTDEDWFITAAALFDLGVAEWRRQSRNIASNAEADDEQN